MGYCNDDNCEECWKKRDEEGRLARVEKIARGEPLSGWRECSC